MPVKEYIETRELFVKDFGKTYFKVYCDKPNCVYNCNASSYEAGVKSYTIHKCPYVGGPTKIGWVMLNPTTLEKAWIALDAALVELIEGNYPDVTIRGGEGDEFGMENPERIRLKGVCRGISEVLAMFMGPHFTTADQISAEAAKRYKAKKAGEEYETVGLGGLRMTPPPGTTRTSVARSTAPSPALSTKFSEEEIGSIRFAHESGMFTLVQLAKAYKVTEAEITKLVGA